MRYAPPTPGGRRGGSGRHGNVTATALDSPAAVDVYARGPIRGREGARTSGYEDGGEITFGLTVSGSEGRRCERRRLA